MLLSSSLRNIRYCSLSFNQRTLPILLKSSNRTLFGYLRVAFNKVDTDRLELVGPDRLCAEWVVKNGGSVSFVDQNRLIKDYNTLQASLNGKPKLQSIDGTDSSIMSLGFEHLKNCKFIDKIILNRCAHMENDALEQLAYVRKSLNVLQVTDCGNVEDNGLLAIKNLTNLKLLILYDFIYVTNLTNIINELQKSLPNCQIISEKTKIVQ